MRKSGSVLSVGDIAASAGWYSYRVVAGDTGSRSRLVVAVGHGMPSLPRPLSSAQLRGDFSLNVANSLSAEIFLASGLKRLAPTHDLNAAQVLCSLRRPQHCGGLLLPHSLFLLHAATNPSDACLCHCATICAICNPLVLSLCSSLILVPSARLLPLSRQRPHGASPIPFRVRFIVRTQVSALGTDFGAPWKPDLRGALEAIVHQHLPIFHTEACVFCRFLSNGNSYKDCGHPCERSTVHLRCASPLSVPRHAPSSGAEK